jgi:antitoxin component of RelBE/YafQ-DinJ toxin-antitoxin module
VCVAYGVLIMTEPKAKMFTAKVDEDLLKAFKHACQNQDTTASQAVRAFMREYVRKHGQADLFK